MNRGQILRYFQKATSPSFNKYFDISPDNCEVCEYKMAREGVMCRPHTTIERMLEMDGGWLYDVDTETYLYRNEVFKRVRKNNGEDLLVIVYCPHTKLISGKITDKKVRKLTPLTIKINEQFEQELAKLDKIAPEHFISVGEKTSCISGDALMEEKLGCWFNDEFHIIVYPDEEPDGSRINNNQNWCLISNY